MDDCLLGFSIPESGPILSIQRPLSPKKDLLIRTHHEKLRHSDVCSVWTQAGQSVHITWVSKTLFLNLCPSVFQTFINIYCFFEQFKPLRKKCQIVAKIDYWIQESLYKKRQSIKFSIISSIFQINLTW